MTTPPSGQVPRPSLHPFKPGSLMAKQFDGTLKAYAEGNHDLVREGGTVRCMGNSMAASFWLGYDGTPPHMVPRGTFAWACYRAGQAQRLIDDKRGAYVPQKTNSIVRPDGQRKTMNTKRFTEAAGLQAAEGRSASERIAAGESPFSVHAHKVIGEYSTAYRLQALVLSMYNSRRWATKDPVQLDNLLANADDAHVEAAIDMMRGYAKRGENDPDFMALGKQLAEDREKAEGGAQ